jgi:hypothetical protein
VLPIFESFGFPKETDGYARDSAGQGPLAWELTADNVLIDRFEGACEYWNAWNDENLWPTIQSSLLSQIEEQTGQHSNYYAIDGGHWPPKALVRIPCRESTVLITIGVCTRPQPTVEMHSEEPELLRRIELAAVLPKRWPDAAVMKFAGYLSGQTNLPWNTYSWLGPEHTVPCDAWQNAGFDFAVLLREHARAPRLSLKPQFGDPVNVLWFVPITAAERQIAIDRGTKELVETLPPDRWSDA